MSNLLFSHVYVGLIQEAKSNLSCYKAKKCFEDYPVKINNKNTNLLDIKPLRDDIKFNYDILIHKKDSGVYGRITYDLLERYEYNPYHHYGYSSDIPIRHLFNN